jgi:hypothetical protein
VPCSASRDASLACRATSGVPPDAGTAVSGSLDVVIATLRAAVPRDLPRCVSGQSLIAAHRP